MTDEEPLEAILRTLTPKVTGILTRRYGDFARCEDAVQEALVEAVATWARNGVPDRPLGWLSTAANRRYLDQVRSDAARERRERASFEAVPHHERFAAPADTEPVRDDLLELLFLCCHPVLSPASQLALTLRAVAGLTTAEIAAAFMVPERTMGQRISRAKKRLEEAGARFDLPPSPELRSRLQIVLQAIYLLFNEGYSASSGPTLRREDLVTQAMQLARQLRHRMPDSGETAGLLALMLLTEARSQARIGPDGIPVALAEQNRSQWDQAMITEGIELVTNSLATQPLGPYQVQAAIAAVHCEAPTAADTDWRQILALYDVLEKLAPGPVVTLNRAVALGEVRGPRSALKVLREVESGPLADNHRLLAVRGHLLESAGNRAEAAEAFRQAARLAGSLPEQRFLRFRAATCASGG